MAPGMIVSLRSVFARQDRFFASPSCGEAAALLQAFAATGAGLRFLAAATAAAIAAGPIAR